MSGYDAASRRARNGLATWADADAPTELAGVAYANTQAAHAWAFDGPRAGATTFHAWAEDHRSGGRGGRRRDRRRFVSHGVVTP